MAEQQGDTELEEASNSFSNDGSFLEQFRKMQEQKAKAEEEKKKREEAEKAQKTKPFLIKTRPVITKLGGFKKGLMPGAKLKKPTGVAVKAFAEGERKELNSNHGNTDPEPVASVQSSSDLTSTSGPPVKKRKSRFSDAPPPGVVLVNAGGPIPDPSGGQSSAAALSGGQSSTAGPSYVDASTVVPPTSGPCKRKSRFSDGPPSSTEEAAMSQVISSFSAPAVPTQQTLTEAQRQQILEQIELNKMVAEIKAATQTAQAAGAAAKYEYDSDEETDGGTWEHKKRAQEMNKTFGKSKELTDMNKGKHHIGDFLPPKELDKFIEKVSAIKEGRNPDFSDYKEHKLTEENVGFKLLQKAGWTEGSGLGSNKDGIVDPINKGKQSFDQSGVGAEPPAEVKKEDDPFDVYRKRMMLSYRFRPNPLNNPRRPYY